MDYSSQSYHASVEVELPDGLTPPQLQQRIHETFSLVRDSVENEITGSNGNTQRDESGPASEKQDGMTPELHYHGDIHIDKAIFMHDSDFNNR